MPAFPEITKIKYEGPQSKNPLAFRWYNESEVVEGKTMREQLRFAVVYWHTFRGTGSDPFGAATMVRPWDDGSNSVENAQNRVRAAFEFIDKLGAPYYAFHDRDVAPEGTRGRKLRAPAAAEGVGRVARPRRGLRHALAARPRPLPRRLAEPAAARGRLVASRVPCYTGGQSVERRARFVARAEPARRIVSRHHREGQ